MKKNERLNAKCKTEDHLTELWKRRIVQEKGYPESIAERITRRLKSLAEYMQYGHAIIAFYKKDGTFQLVTGTLISYQREFQHPFSVQQVHSVFTFWCMEAKGWRTFQIENFLEWKPMI